MTQLSRDQTNGYHDDSFQPDHEPDSQEGIKQGLQQSQQASLSLSRQLIMSVVQLRFADLLPELLEKIAQLNDLEQMRRISIRISTAQNADQVRAMLEMI